MSLTVNGERRDVSAGETLAGLLHRLGLDPAKVAVERNRAIAPRSSYGRTLLSDGDELEIVHFVGGG
ncbi:MAG: sulfur carrier protein ThiS [Hyphomonadaceae bacterium]